MHFTDIFIKKPVLATVISLLILVLGLRSMGLLPIRQYPFTENAVVTVTTAFTGANPSVIAGFITTPLETSIAQAQGIDYMTSITNQGTSTINVNLLLNYDSKKALTEINTKVNAVLNQLPKQSQLPVITIAVGETIDSMYLGFYSDVLANNMITDYLLRVVQPKLQAVPGVQQAEIIGNRQFALRAWLDPLKMASYGLTANDVANAMTANDFISSSGRTDGNMVTYNLTASTGLNNVAQFEKMVIKTQNGAIIRLQDLAKVTLGAQNYDTSVQFNGKEALYIGIKVAPGANILNVVDNIKKIFPAIQEQLPGGLSARIVYDATKYIESAIHNVIDTLLEASIIVTVVIFLFLGSFRSLLIPLVTIPLSLIGTFFIMLILGYSINLLTLLAFVLAIGLVVDDAIIVVENVHRHMEEGIPVLQATILSARELTNPIMAITAVLIAVYLPIGFMGGLTGALFTEFAFTLAATVTVSAIIALTLSPMMSSKLLKVSHTGSKGGLVNFIDRQFAKLDRAYERQLDKALNYLPVIGIFALIVVISIYFLYITSKNELAPQEDQGIIISQSIGSPNASLRQTQLFSKEVFKIFHNFSETDHIFQLDGIGGLNMSVSGMVLKPWDQRIKTTNQLQPVIQNLLNGVGGVKIAAFQPPSLPGGGTGLPVQFVIQTSEPFDQLNEISQAVLDKARASGKFLYLDSDLKYDKAQTNIIIDRDKASELGLTMVDVGNVLASALSQAYINYFNYDERSYQVIPQVKRSERLNSSQLLDYYIKTANGTSVPLSTIARLETKIVPQTINHFQRMNSATLSAIAFPGITMGQALDTLDAIAKNILPDGYTIDYASQSRQYKKEGAALIITFFFALIMIFLALAALFESFRDPFIVLITVPMSIFGAIIFISLGIGGASINIYTQVGLVTLIGLITKHGILIVQFANELQKAGKSKREAVESAAAIRLRPILMTTAAMVLGVVPLLLASGAGAASRFNIGLVIFTGLSIGTLFTLFVVPAMYLVLAQDHKKSEPNTSIVTETT
jgi:multidrug efflux pump